MLPFISADTSLFHAVNGLAGRSPVLDAAGAFCADQLIWLMAIAVLVRAAMLAFRRDTRAGAYLAAVMRGTFAVAFSLAGNWLFGQFVHFRERPFVSLYGVDLLATAPYGWQSFPSGHAAAAFAIAFSVWYEDRHAGIVLLVMAVGVAFGRVFAGVHYPLDVIAGAAAGFFWAWAARAAGRRLGDERLAAKLLKRGA